MSIHQGHRERLKNRFRQEGLDNFDEIQVLELLLFYAIPQKDTNPIAHALLDRFGSLAGVLEAPTTDLEQVPGIGAHASTLIALITAAARFYQVRRASTAKILTTVEQCGNYLVPQFFGRRDETVCVLCLDAKCKVLSCRMFGEGSADSTGVPIRNIVAYALSLNASTVVLAHNHPSGIALPSEQDVSVTRLLDAALRAVDIVLADHIIVADGDFVSLVQSGLLQRWDQGAYFR